MNKSNLRLSTRDIAMVGVMIASVEVAKISLSFLPNIELVTLLLILYTLFFGSKIIYVVFSFVLIEGCLYGFGIWWLMYLYIWPLLVLLTRLFRKQQSIWFWSVFSGIYGLFFGALCSIVYFFIGGVHTAFAWWISGIPSDLIHGISNFILCFVLFRPLKNALKRFSDL